MVKKQKKINKKMTFAELIKANPKAANMLAEKGMFCCGCPMAMMESLEDGASAHGLSEKDVEKLVKELNK